MKNQLFALIIALVAFSFGCAGATSDLDAQDDEGYTLAGETEPEDAKGDNIRGKKLSWKSIDEFLLTGTTYSGVAEIVATKPDVRIKTSSIVVNVNEFPAEISIQSNGGFLSTEKMNFVLYGRPDSSSDWEQIKFQYQYEYQGCVCSKSKCETMAAAAQRCQGMITTTKSSWRYESVAIDEDTIEVDGKRFNSPVAGNDSYQLKIVPIPFGKWGNMKGEYKYTVEAKCFGGACDSDESGGWQSL